MSTYVYSVQKDNPKNWVLNKYPECRAIAPHSRFWAKSPFSTPEQDLSCEPELWNTKVLPESEVEEFIAKLYLDSL